MITDWRSAYQKLLVENTILKKEIAELRSRLNGSNIEEPIQQEHPLPIDEEIDSDIITVCQDSSPDRKIDFFMSLFRGREDVYALRWNSAKTGKSGYSPVCLNQWKTGLCNKQKIKCNSCHNRILAGISKDAIDKHLRGIDPNGNDVAGIYPMTEDECTWFLAIDFDGNETSDWKHDIDAFRNSCKTLMLNISVERSRSGNGAHVWFFFNEKISASTARRFGSALLTNAMESRHEIQFSSYDRLFPNQDPMPNGGFGNLI
jgi:hypothetical protein